MKKISAISIAIFAMTFGIYQLVPASANADVSAGVGIIVNVGNPVPTITQANNAETATIPSPANSNASEAATIPAVSGANYNENATIPALNGSNNAENATIPVISGANNNENATIPFNAGANGNEGGRTIPNNSGANGNEGGVIIPVMQGTNGSEDNAIPEIPVVPVVPEAPAAQIISSGSSGGYAYGGGYSSGGSTGVIASANTLNVRPSTTTCPLITSFMGTGWANDPVQVVKVQIFLKNSEGLDVNVNGSFDRKTETAIRAFQQKYLSAVMGPWGSNQPSGYVYITTQKKINQLSCASPLTLSQSDLAIIDAYKLARTAGIAANTANASAGPIPVNNAASTTNTDDSFFTPATTTAPIGPVLGAQNGTSNNTASVGNATVLQRFWGFVKGLF